MQSAVETLISVKDVSFVRERRTILSHINLDVNRGDFLAITGPNGGGKTTLLRLMLKLLTPSAGKVIYHGDSKMFSIGYLPQKNMIDSSFPITVRQVVESGLMFSKLTRQAQAGLVESTIETIGLTNRADYPIARLSGGQLQRALLGRAIIASPRLLVMDEPLSYVDKNMEQRIYDIIEKLTPETTIVLVSHEMSRIGQMATRHIIIDETLTECHTRHHHFFDDCQAGLPSQTSPFNYRVNR
ncbi:MAG: ATP-binding cassette domain-containing protein [Muribaculaceae bacterium]|nr:ATP-binding cassette domain-containing protein [Muribaculaceae bacterium]